MHPINILEIPQQQKSTAKTANYTKKWKVGSKKKTTTESTKEKKKRHIK